MSRKLLTSLKSLPYSKIRSDIVNPKLCDDIIQRLKPTLAPYIGCTIIDINPGACLFSQKLHDHLNPRSHILLEPKLDHYGKFIRPLLEGPNSRYHYRDWPDEHCWGTAQFIHEGLMPDLNGVGGPDPTTDDPNNMALIIANVTNWAQRALGRARKKNYALLKASDFARKVRECARSKNDVPSRMLLWTADSDKHPIVPRTVDSRGRTSAILEPYCHVEEIVGSNKPRIVRRETELDARSMQRVARTKQAGNISKRLSHPNTDVKASDELSITYRDWHQELRELEEGFKARRIPQYNGLPPGPLRTPKRGTGPPDYSPEFKRMVTLQRTLTGQNAEIKKAGDLLQKQAKIDQLDHEAALSKSTDKDEQQKKYEEIDALNAELKVAQSKLSRKELSRFMYLDDDRRAFDMKPPLLMWDRRGAEPLIAQEKDFHHPRELALLDFQIKPVPDIPATTPNQDLYYDMLIAAFMSHKTPVNAKFLDTVGPGAYQALIKHAPSLQSPLKGGRRDVESVRSRTMTPEMLRELAVAWDEWPFKPNLAETLIRSDPSMELLTRDGGPAARL